MEEKAKPLRILMIEDNPGDARLVKEMLAQEKNLSFELEWKDTLGKGLKRLDEGGIDLILLDLQLPDSPQRFGTIARMQAAAAKMPIVVMTGLNDETFAIAAVRKGVQDYLVKGKIDSATLVRTIRYAIARKSGEERIFTLHELESYDGKDGRPAYVAFQGRVYDVTASPLWKDGLHGNLHDAGRDLTESMLGAPHGAEILAKAHIVGEIAGQESFIFKLSEYLESWHPHPIIVHFAIAYSIGMALFASLYVLIRNDTFELFSWYLLILSFGFNFLAGLSGLFSWLVTYAGRLNRNFLIKIIFSILLVIVTGICFFWRLDNPAILSMHTNLGYVYFTLTMSLVPISVVLGYFGGEIVYA